MYTRWGKTFKTLHRLVVKPLLLLSEPQVVL